MQFFKSAEPPAMAGTVSPSPLQFVLGPQILDINSRGLPQYLSFFWGSFYSCSASGWSVSACVTGISPRLDPPFPLVLVVVDHFPDKQFLIKDNILGFHWTSQSVQKSNPERSQSRSCIRVHYAHGYAAQGCAWLLHHSQELENYHRAEINAQSASMSDINAPRSCTP